MEIVLSSELELPTMVVLLFVTVIGLPPCNLSAAMPAAFYFFTYYYINKIRAKLQKIKKLPFANTFSILKFLYNKELA
jgi:hypothetical protein